MGANCCCLRDDLDDIPNPACAICANCLCLDYIAQKCLRGKAFLNSRIIAPEGYLSVNMFALQVIFCCLILQYVSPQGVASSNDSSLENMCHSPPRPLPYDADPVYYRIQRNGLVSRKDKGSSHSNEESEPLRPCEDTEECESMVPKNKSGNKKVREINPKTSVKLSASKPASGFAHIYTCSEDEDVCPTCLEEYTEEDPKIVTQCSHHFHLGCVYEWMERSDNCPVCGKVMEFNETR